VESHKRSLAKAVSYRVFGSLSTGAMVYLFTQSARISVGAVFLDSIVKIILYFLHERVWNYIPYGRPSQPPSDAPNYEI
jgi:uncharacterized membrane protein